MSATVEELAVTVAQLRAELRQAYSENERLKALLSTFYAAGWADALHGSGTTAAQIRQELADSARPHLRVVDGEA